MIAPELIADEVDTPSDTEIINTLAEVFDMTPAEVIERLICIDFVAARLELA